MKTTVHIPDALYEEARLLAQREGTTIKSIVEEGVRRIVSERRQPAAKPFRLRDGSFGGQGLRPEFQGKSWEEIRDFSYGSRGGGATDDYLE